jgi:hypothetical protein
MTDGAAKDRVSSSQGLSAASTTSVSYARTSFGTSSSCANGARALAGTAAALEASVDGAGGAAAGALPMVCADAPATAKSSKRDVAASRLGSGHCMLAESMESVDQPFDDSRELVHFRHGNGTRGSQGYDAK